MKRFKVIACEVAFRELCFCASQSSAVVDFSFMPRRLHVVGSKEMRETLQSEIDSVDVDKYQAILLAYGRCGNGVVGLHSKLPMVIPKAQDCISLFLGCKHRYADFQKEHPKAFYLTPGWVEREMVPTQGSLLENLSRYKSVLREIVFLDTGVGHIEEFKAELLEDAESADWLFTDIKGDNSLLSKLLNGEWNEEDFAIIPPNHTIVGPIEGDIIGYAAEELS